MAESPIGTGFLAPIGGGPLLSRIGDGLAAFADGVAGRFMSADATVQPAEQTFAADGSAVSLQQHVNLNFEIGAASPSPAPPAPMEVHREAVEREVARSVERHTETARVETLFSMHERLVEQFRRVEREVLTAPAPESARRPEDPRVTSREAAVPPLPREPMVFHRPPPPAAVTQPVEVRRELPRSQGQPGEKAISEREVSRVADEVIAVLNRQSVAWRERFGRG